MYGIVHMKDHICLSLLQAGTIAEAKFYFDIKKPPNDDNVTNATQNLLPISFERGSKIKPVHFLM